LIKKRIIKEFLGRKREDWREAKTWSDDAIERRRALLPVLPPMWSRLKRHQRVCLLIGAELKRFAFFLDTGCGKTVLSIALARFFRKAGVAKRCLILVPRRANTGEWVREIKKHAPGTSWCVLKGSSTHKWERLEHTKALLVITTYAGLTRMVCAKGVNRRGKNKMMPVPKLVRKLATSFDALFMDESTEVKNKAKLPYRICRQIAKRAPATFALSGTPFGRDPSDLWGQMSLVDAGASLGETLGLFRAAFFNAKPDFWGRETYTFNKKMSGELHRCLAHRSLRYEADQADLPRVVRINKSVTLRDDADVYFQEARKELIKAKGNYIESKNAFNRLRQISSGFIGYKDDDTGAKAQFEFDDNPKLEMLLSLIESIREDRKVVVFNEFIYSGARISSELTDMKVKHVRVYGGTKDPAAALKAFVNDPSMRVLVLQNSMVLGLNVQVARYGIFYESPVPVIMRKQAERRVERQHSTHDKVFLYDLVTRGTMDERILAFHKQGGDLFKAIIGGKAKV